MLENVLQPATTDNTTYCYWPDLMLESELIQFLRVDQISDAKNPHNVIAHLTRYRDLPRMHLCNKSLYPLAAVREWVTKQTLCGN
jgi:hypothetical protein